MSSSSGRLLEGTVGNWNFSLRADGKEDDCCCQLPTRLMNFEISCQDRFQTTIGPLNEKDGFAGHYNVSDGPATRDTAQLAYSMQPFASGPVPHSRWLMGDKYQNSYDKNGNHNGNPPAYKMSPGPYTVDLAALASEAGGTIGSAEKDIIDDDNAGTVSRGGAFCVAAHSGAALEVWAGLLSPSAEGQHRWAVALVNRSPSSDHISVEFAKLPDLHLLGLGAEKMAARSFQVEDVWLDTNHTAMQGVKWGRDVEAHDTALLIVTLL